MPCLTPAETKIIQLFRSGRDESDIALELKIPKCEVHDRITSILIKFDNLPAYPMAS